MNALVSPDSDLWVQACKEGLAMIPSELQVALQCGSGLPLVSLQAGCECCFTTAVLRCCFLLWHLGLNSGVPIPIQSLFVPQEPLWTVLPGSQREGIAETNSLLAVPHCIHTLSIPSSKYGFVNSDVGYAVCPQMPFPNQTLASLFHSMPYGGIFSIHWIWCHSTCLAQRPWDVGGPASVVSSELVFLPRDEFMVSWAIGDGRGACSVVDHFFCLLVMEFLEFLCFSKMDAVRYFLRAMAGGMEKLWLEIALH